MKSAIRIASGQGFWGDLPSAPVTQVKKGPVDYLVMDYLAEVTMSILQKQRMRDRNYGYAHDVIRVIDQILPEISGKGVRVITNAGGINPEACKDVILEKARKHSIRPLKVAVVDGDDILDQIESLTGAGYALDHMETGEPVASVRNRLLSANVYFGARPIVAALQQDADIVITGRVTDASLTLAAMAYEFGWPFDDKDKMASGIVAGHLIECGAQVSGGNFTDWEQVKDLACIGFPIIEAYPDGTFSVTKHEGTGGLVNEMTVKEQLVYEIGDPKAYLTPDGIADFTTVQLTQEEENRVKVSGIKGRPETETYKVSASYSDGYKLSSTLVYSWPAALRKAVKAGEILQHRSDSLGLQIDRLNLEYVGFNACSEVPVGKSELSEEFNEVELRISAAGYNKEDLERFGREIVPLILTGPSGATGYAGGRPKASEVVAFWPALLKKEAVEPRVRIFNS